MKNRVLSGIRATGRLHLGNYLGAVKGMVELQNNPNYETFYMVADLHTLTTPFETGDFQLKIKDIVLDYLSAGLDPKKCTLFVQSHVKELLELAYIFSTQVMVARMQRMPTFKEKIKQYSKNVNVALLNYPVLMAADILLYKADLVPVGIDQEPHLEIAREVARKMNKKFGTDFPEPKRFVTKGEYIPSLTGEGKMSKSVPGSSISLADNLETIKEKLAKTPTDLGKGERVPDKGGVNTLLTLVELFEGKEKRGSYEKDYLEGGIKYSSLKEELAKAIYTELISIQEKRAKLEKDPDYIEKILKEGSLKAIKVASKTLLEVKKAMGLI